MVEDGTENEGPLYVCVGGSVDLEAKLYPYAPIPRDEPTWTIVAYPTGANPSLSTYSGSRFTTLSGLTETGDYEVKAQCGNADPGDTIIVTVVEVDKIVKTGTIDEGPLYVVCPGDTVDLEAKPYPASASFPSGEPHWTVEGPPGSNPFVSPLAGPTTRLYGVVKPGTYVVKAKCGGLDDGDTIDVITPPPKLYTRSFLPGDPSPIYDDCGNTLEVYDDTRDFCPPEEPFRAFNWWYTPYGSWDGTRVGLCVWTGGVNTFTVWITIAEIYGKERFIRTKHLTQNDGEGNDDHGEGCPGYWCWRVEKYDCVNNTHEGIWWRRRVGSPGTRETQGEPCPGTGGIHTCHPN